MPVPVSPWIRTVASVGEIVFSSRWTVAMPGDSPIRRFGPSAAWIRVCRAMFLCFSFRRSTILRRIASISTSLHGFSM